MRIVLIGGSGFIGSNLLNMLIKEEHELIVYDILEPSIKSDKYLYIKGSINEEEKIQKLLKQKDCVIHLASTSVPKSSNNDIYLDASSNLLPTIKLLEICERKRVSKIIFASSGGSIYGLPRYLPIDEKHDENPNSSYGINKLAIEKYLRLISNRSGINVVILRISNPYGIGQKPFKGQGVISTFIASVLLGKTIEVWGNGDAIRDYLYIDDLIQAFRASITYNGKETVFNIGSGKGTNINEILNMIKKNIKKNINIKYIKESEVEVKTNILNCKKAEDILKWKANIPLECGILKMIKSWDGVRFRI